MGLKISNDGSLLLPSQRYAKVAYGMKGNDDEKFFWDPTTKCLRNYMYRDGCVGTTQQGCATQMIALGKSEDAGRTCGDVKFDGTFLWMNGKVAQPQSGYLKTNNIHVSLGDITGHVSQRWAIKSTGINAKSRKSKQSTPEADSTWGWPKGAFEIRAPGSKAVQVLSNGRVILNRRTGGTDQQFYFDAKTKTIVSRRFNGFSLTSVKSGKDRFKIVAKKTNRTSPQLFTRPSSGGLVQMASNKNYVWKATNNSLVVVKGNGDRNWNRSRTYFQAVKR